jgi:hypothetical protein
MRISQEQWNRFCECEIGEFEYVRINLDELNKFLESIENEDKKKENNIRNDPQSRGSRASFFAQRNLHGTTPKHRRETFKDSKSKPWKVDR